MALFNSIFIPYLVYYICEFQFFEKKSSRERSKLVKYLFYIFLNTLIMPIVNSQDMTKFIMSYAFRLEKLNKIMSNNLIENQNLFQRYIITCSFLSQCWSLVDIPHTFFKMIGKQKKDDYFFDQSYFVAFNMVIFTMVLMYAIVSPSILIFGSIYFWIKYIIDKYNLTVLYPKDYDNNG
jgi:hypothetical protein